MINEKVLNIEGLTSFELERERVPLIETGMKISEAPARELLIFTVLSLLRLKSEALYYHSLKTSILAYSIILEFSGDIERICPNGVKLAAILHDIGKLSVPDGVLNKRGKLNPEEIEMIKLHPLKSYETAVKILDRHFATAATNGSVHCCKTDEITEMILSHHELPDGSGYPHGKNYLSLATKIIGIADKMCALSEERTYRSIIYPLDYTIKKVLHEIDWGLETVHLKAINVCATKLLTL